MREREKSRELQCRSQKREISGRAWEWAWERTWQSHVMDKGWTCKNAQERSDYESRDVRDFKRKYRINLLSVLQLLQVSSWSLSLTSLLNFTNPHFIERARHRACESSKSAKSVYSRGRVPRRQMNWMHYKAWIKVHKPLLSKVMYSRLRLNIVLLWP